MIVFAGRDIAGIIAAAYRNEDVPEFGVYVSSSAERPVADEILPSHIDRSLVTQIDDDDLDATWDVDANRIVLSVRINETPADIEIGSVFVISNVSNAGGANSPSVDPFPRDVRDIILSGYLETSRIKRSNSILLVEFQLPVAGNPPVADADVDLRETILPREILRSRLNPNAGSTEWDQANAFVFRTEGGQTLLVLRSGGVDGDGRPLREWRVVQNAYVGTHHVAGSDDAHDHSAFPLRPVLQVETAGDSSLEELRVMRLADRSTTAVRRRIVGLMDENGTLVRNGDVYARLSGLFDVSAPALFWDRDDGLQWRASGGTAINDDICLGFVISTTHFLCQIDRGGDALRAPKGLPGVLGDEATQGPQGEKGVMGDQGDAGPVGPSSTEPAPDGPEGAEGPVGPAGPPGPSLGPGAKGIKGDRGDLGLVGEPGEPGDPGAIGVDGVPGVPGDAGPTGPPGANIKGLPGPAGIPGTKGPKGDRGPAGFTGPSLGEGPTGPAGRTGSAGSTGPTGLTGPAGSKGLPGPDGPRGSGPGPKGLRGPKGFRGPPGPPGPDFHGDAGGPFG